MGTGDTFNELQKNLPQIPLEAYRQHYTELTRRVVAEGKDITPDIMHAMIIQAHNEQPKQEKPKT